MSESWARDEGCFGWLLEPDPERVWLRLWGELDLAHVDLVYHALDDLHADGWLHIGLDLRRLRVLDGAGVHLLADEASHARLRGGSLIVTDGPVSEQVLELCGLGDQFTRERPRTRPHNGLIASLTRLGWPG